jgi:hypothetical protein
MSTAKITATNYTAILSSVTSVLTTYYGYPQLSKSVVTGGRITAVDWGNIYRDINHALIHQTGNAMPFPNIVKGSVLTQQFVNSLTNYVVQINNNKATVAAGQLGTYQTLSTRSTAWGSNITHETMFVWPNATAAQNFFNQGSYLLANIERTVNAGSKQENIDWSTLIYNAKVLLEANPQLIDYRLSDYNGSYPGYQYFEGAYTIDVSYTKVNAYTIIGMITFNVQSVNGLSIDVLPSAGFEEYQSTNIYGGTLAPSPDIITMQSLDVGGATLYPSLIYVPAPISNVPQLASSTIKTFTITNTGTGICTITGATFVGESGSGLVGVATVTSSTLRANSSTTVSLNINSSDGVRGSYYRNYVYIYSDSITGNELTAKIPLTVSAPAFTVGLSPATVTVNVTTADPVVTHFTFGAGATGNIYSYTGSLNTTLNGRLGITGLTPAQDHNLGDDYAPNNRVYDNLLYTTFLPPTSNVLGDVVGTYTATLTVTFLPYDYNQSATTVTVPITYNVNIPNRHLGKWLSAKARDNAVMGASYDIINGVRTLTLGFGMGHDGGPQCQDGGTRYASADVLGISGDPYSFLGIPLFASSSPNYCSFLQTYGSWISVNGAGRKSTFDLYYNFTVPVAGTYYAEFGSVGTSALFINGTQYSTWSNKDTTTRVSFPLNAGNNVVRLLITSSGGVDSKDKYTKITRTQDQDGNVTETKELIPANKGIPWYGSVGVNITDSNGNSWWDTRRPRRTAYAYWAEVYRIPLTQGKHLYKSRDYLVKTNDFALGRTYGSWCGEDELAGCMFAVEDDGRGNIVMSMVPWPAKESTGELSLSLTLIYAVGLPFYYNLIQDSAKWETGEKLGRYNQLEGPFQKDRTRFFLGFKSSGQLNLLSKAYPYSYKPPPGQAGYGKKGEEPDSFWANLFVALILAAVFYFAVGYYLVAAAIFTLTINVVAAVVAVVVFIVSFLNKVCFTGDSLISMSDGTFKPIKDVQVGDLVFNRHKTANNRVTFVEKTTDDRFGYLYSISVDEEPFITVNHPMYIDDELHSVYPDRTYNAYPWLGMTKQLIPDRMVPASGQDVYNLWVTGDGTFIVNGYGTTSIMGDGGWARLLAEQGISTPERVSEVLHEMASAGKDVSYGAFICNKILGKLDIKIINRIFGKIMDSKENTRTRRAIKYTFKLVGKVAVYLAERKMRK